MSETTQTSLPQRISLPRWAVFIAILACALAASLTMHTVAEVSAGGTILPSTSAAAAATADNSAVPDRSAAIDKAFAHSTGEMLACEILALLLAAIIGMVIMRARHRPILSGPVPTPQMPAPPSPTPSIAVSRLEPLRV